MTISPSVVFEPAGPPVGSGAQSRGPPEGCTSHEKGEQPDVIGWEDIHEVKAHEAIASGLPEDARVADASDEEQGRERASIDPREDGWARDHDHVRDVDGKEPNGFDFEGDVKEVYEKVPEDLVAPRVDLASHGEDERDHIHCPAPYEEPVQTGRFFGARFHAVQVSMSKPDQ